MDRKLIEIPLGELLDKFGAGSHKPGSGSAAALLAMVSAKMVITVIELTKEKPAYAKYVPHFMEISELIENRYYPELVALFQRDSDEFDGVILLRRQRDDETNLVKRRKVVENLEKAMRIATQIPLRIAELSLDLGNMAIEVFDHGFKAVRGDSGVGLTSAISAISGCMYIVELNLASTSPGEWMEEIGTIKSQVMDKYGELLQKQAERHRVLQVDTAKHLSAEFEKAMVSFRQGNLSRQIRTDTDLESLVRDFQNQLWIHRERIWGEEPPESHISILQPDVVFKKVLGYDFIELSTLGQHDTGGVQFEVAGMIDKGKKLVQISRKFPDDSMRFTAAHELGHALLHEQKVLHRDRALDRTGRVPRTTQEEEADKFATFFLMPAKAVKKAFELGFEMPRFELNQGNFDALRTRVDFFTFKLRCENRRGLARYIAGAEYFGGNTFVPLANLFRVSIETMAIRLEELDLVSF